MQGNTELKNVNCLHVARPSVSCTLDLNKKDKALLLANKCWRTHRQAYKKKNPKSKTSQHLVSRSGYYSLYVGRVQGCEGCSFKDWILNHPALIPSTHLTASEENSFSNHFANKTIIYHQKISALRFVKSKARVDPRVKISCTANCLFARKFYGLFNFQIFRNSEESWNKFSLDCSNFWKVI